MTKKSYNICIGLLLFLGFVCSFFVWVGVTNVQGSLHFTLQRSTQFYFAHIALNSAPGEKCYSGILGISCYIAVVMMMIRHSREKNRLLNISFLLLLLVLFAFEIYTILLVAKESFKGQHLRIPIPLFLVGLYLYRNNKFSGSNI
jgi:hypothetical protein